MKSARQPDPDRAWALKVSLAAIAVTCLPYLYGLFLSGAGDARAWYSWLGYTLDDDCVYWAWIREAADGRFFHQNLFTTEAQAGRQFNLFFFLIGQGVRLTEISVPIAYQAARVLCAFLLLHVAWWFLQIVLPERGQRRKAFALICFAAGLGWIPGLWQEQGQSAPVDVWQPEAITFLCLYLRPLFSISLALMLGSLGWMFIAERDRSMKAALLAGVCALLLGNVHGYDVITVCAVAGVWLVWQVIAQRKLETGTLARVGLAGGLAALSAGYQFWLLRTEAVFAKRAAVETLSPPVLQYALGFGLLVPLAVIGAHHLLRKQSQEERSNSGKLLISWAIVNLLVAYLPVAFQRKMAMGLHLPLSILAGVALHQWAAGQSKARARLAVAGVVALTFITNARFLIRDSANLTNNRAQTTLHRLYLLAGEVDALNWLRTHAKPGAAIQPIPWVAATPDGKAAFVDITLPAMTPGLTGHAVHAGHWGETPDFGSAMSRWVAFVNPALTDDQRRGLVLASGVRYIVLGQKRTGTSDDLTQSNILDPFRKSIPGWLKPVHSNEDVDIYEVDL